jgi:hypothetical protein
VVIVLLQIFGHFQYPVGALVQSFALILKNGVLGKNRQLLLMNFESTPVLVEA